MAEQITTNNSFILHRGVCIIYTWRMKKSMKRSGWSVSEANAQRRSRATTFSPKTWRKNNLSDDQLVPNSSPEIYFWAFYLVEPCNQDCWSLLVKLVGSEYLTIWIHIDPGEYVAVFFKKMAISPLLCREPEWRVCQNTDKGKDNPCSANWTRKKAPGVKERAQPESVKLFSRIKFNPTKNKKRKTWKVWKGGRAQEDSLLRLPPNICRISVQLFFLFVKLDKMDQRFRHGICPKIYTAGFSG